MGTKSLVGPSIVVALVSGLSVLTGVPRLWAPLPLVPFLASLFLGPLGYGLFTDDNNYLTPFEASLSGAVAAALVVTLLFLAWYHRVSHAERIPRRSAVTFVIIGCLDLLSIAAGWSYGVQYQGLDHTIVILVYNVLAVTGCVFLYRMNRRTPSQRTNVVFHTACFAVLGFCAFPMLGELP